MKTLIIKKLCILLVLLYMYITMHGSKNVKLRQLFGDINILCFVRVSQLKWIAYVNRMNYKRKVSEVFNINLQGS
jgi:hypothetical protein